MVAAVKVLRQRTLDAEAHIQEATEIALLNSLRHPNIVQIHGVISNIPFSALEKCWQVS